MPEEASFPLIAVSIKGRSKRLPQDKWRNAIKTGAIRPDTPIAFLDAPNRSASMLAGDCLQLRPLFDAESPSATPDRPARNPNDEALDHRLRILHDQFAELSATLLQAQRFCAELVLEIEDLRSEYGQGVVTGIVLSPPKPAAPEVAPPPAPVLVPENAPQTDVSPDLQLYNDMKNLQNLEDLREQWNARSFSNDRQRDIAELFESESDRFWLIENPRDRNAALLIPGATSKRKWQTMRDVTADHPLAHHFTMTPGDKLVVLRPALLQRGDGGSWILVEKGAISGTRQ